MTRTEISNSDDVIDSRDVIARIEELSADTERTHDEQNELDTLLDLAQSAVDYAADWEYGETLIRDSYFKEYAQELQMDYTSVDFDGVTYWVR